MNGLSDRYGNISRREGKVYDEKNNNIRYRFMPAAFRMQNVRAGRK